MRKIVGVIGGSGLYEMEGLTEIREVRMRTPFGEPSDVYVRGFLNGTELIFLPRHGRGHRWLPSEVNFRANIFGMKKLGAEWIISVSAVGSLREWIAPGHIVVPDQFIDRTVHRPSTFFGKGVVAHVGFADPVCPVLSGALTLAGRQAGAEIHPKGTYLCMEGPQFSSRAESVLYRSWGADIIGMTNLPEAKLAREAEICFATLAMSTDYDCWNQSAGNVEIDEVLKVLQRNARLAHGIIRTVAAELPEERSCPCAFALKDAIITEKSRIPKARRTALKPLLGKYVE